MVVGAWALYHVLFFGAGLPACAAVFSAKYLSHLLDCQMQCHVMSTTGRAWTALQSLIGLHSFMNADHLCLLFWKARSTSSEHDAMGICRLS